MSISYAFYELEPLCSLSSISSSAKREGVLLKVLFDQNIIGYADCHCWPELGDLPVRQQLTLFMQGQPTPLIRSALELAKLDGTCRKNGIPAIQGKHIPRSHFLVNDIFQLTPSHIQKLLEQGYTHLKLKMGRNIEQEVECLYHLFSNSSLKLRLDFNEILSQKMFHQFLEKIEKLGEQIDFIEDPFPFNHSQWTKIQQEGWVLACDREIYKGYNQPDAAKVLIIKPALQSYREFKPPDRQTSIVTSYLGHPLGQVAAAYIARQIDPDCNSVHGLLSHHAYQPNSFSKHLNWKSPAFIPPSGIGFGFEQELENQDWIRLL